MGEFVPLPVPSEEGGERSIPHLSVGERVSRGIDVGVKKTGDGEEEGILDRWRDQPSKVVWASRAQSDTLLGLGLNVGSGPESENKGISFYKLLAATTHAARVQRLFGLN